MIVQDIQYTMKNGRQALIRCPREEDIQGLLDYLYQSACETDFIVRCPEECNQYTPEGEKAFIENVNAAGNVVYFVVLVNEKVIGIAQVSWSRSMKMKHRAAVAIALLKEYWNQGIGTRVMQELIHIAEANPDILQIELDFIEGNSRARALYEKLGFRIQMTKRRSPYILYSS